MHLIKYGGARAELNVLPGLSLVLNDVQAKTMHISMCIKDALREDNPAAEKNRFLVLLDTIMLFRTNVDNNEIIHRAIRQAAPGRSQSYTFQSLR